MANFNQNLVFTGLGNVSVTVPSAGPYVVDGHMSIPNPTMGGKSSSLLVVVNQNGSPIYTGQAGAEGFRATMNCAALDVIQFVFSSAAADDQPINVIKSNIQISSGE